MARRLGAQRLERIGGRLVSVPDIGPRPERRCEHDLPDGCFACHMRRPLTPPAAPADEEGEQPVSESGEGAPLVDLIAEVLSDYFDPPCVTGQEFADAAEGVLLVLGLKPFTRDGFPLMVGKRFGSTTYHAADPEHYEPAYRVGALDASLPTPVVAEPSSPEARAADD